MRQIDWNTAEIELTERDGCKLWGIIQRAEDLAGEELSEDELDFWANEPEMYERLASVAWGQ